MSTELNPTPVLDLSALDVRAAAEAGLFVHLRHPGTKELLFDAAGAPIGVEIEGTDGERCATVTRMIVNARVDRAQKTKSTTVDIATIEDEGAVRLAAVTRRWNLPPIDGAALECTPRNAKALYLNPRFSWIPEQLNEAFGDRASFFARTPAS